MVESTGENNMILPRSDRDLRVDWNHGFALAGKPPPGYHAQTPWFWVNPAVDALIAVRASGEFSFSRKRIT